MVVMWRNVNRSSCGKLKLALKATSTSYHRFQVRNHDNLLFIQHQAWIKTRQNKTKNKRILDMLLPWPWREVRVASPALETYIYFIVLHQNIQTVSPPYSCGLRSLCVQREEFVFPILVNPLYECWTGSIPGIWSIPVCVGLTITLTLGGVASIYIEHIKHPYITAFVKMY